MWAGNRKPSPAYLHRRKIEEQFDSPFIQPSGHRGTSRRGKKGHFALLDKYIRRVDALVPEEMEHLIKPLAWKPPGELSETTLKLTFEEDVDGKLLEEVTEQDVRRYFAPLEPQGVVMNFPNVETGAPQIFVNFETNEECREARSRDAEPLGSKGILRPQVRISRAHWWKKAQKWKAENAEALEGGGSDVAKPLITEAPAAKLLTSEEEDEEEEKEGDHEALAAKLLTSEDEGEEEEGKGDPPPRAAPGGDPSGG